jgi:YVTN family beta-propeller protein/VCBS repeat-containing protein
MSPPAADVPAARDNRDEPPAAAPLVSPSPAPHQQSTEAELAYIDRALVALPASAATDRPFVASPSAPAAATSIAPGAVLPRPASAVATPASAPFTEVRTAAQAGEIGSVLDTLLGVDPSAPVQSPVGWMVLAAARRRDGRVQPATAAAVTTGQAAALPAPASTASNPVAYIADFQNNAVITVDTVTYATKTITKDIGRGPAGLAVNPAGTLALVPSMGDCTVAVIDTAKGAVTKVIPISKTPVNVTFSPDGKRAYVISQGGVVNGVPANGFVSVIDTAAASGPVLTTTKYDVGPGPAGAAVNGTKLYVVNNAGDSVSLIDTTTGTVKTVPVEFAPQAVAFSKDGTLAYVTNSGDSSVSVIDTVKGEVKSTIPVFLLGNPMGASLGAGKSAAVTIRNDDVAPPAQGPISVPIAPSWPGRTGYEVRNNFAFAALRDDGSVVTWGDKALGGDSTGVAGLLTDPKKPVAQIYSSSRAFAALRGDGSVVTWGSADSGGNSTAVTAMLNDPAKQIVQIYSTDNAFAALRSDGSVVTWGSKTDGGDSSKVAAFLDGKLLPVGATGDPAPDSRKITQIVSTGSAFAALSKGGSVVTWGRDGGDSSKVTAALTDPKNPVIEISSTKGAFAALRSDGSVVTWGPTNQFDANNKPIDYGADKSSVAAQLSDRGKPVTRIYSNGFAFAALRSDGSVVTWGSKAAGGGSSVFSLATTGAPVETSVAAQLTGGVSQIYSTNNAFAALKSDGTVVTWGGRNTGGSSGSDPKNVDKIVAGDTAFAALLKDGSVVTWGLLGQTRVDATTPNSAVGKQGQDLYANGSAFAALLKDGSVVTWGTAGYGGDSTAAAAKIRGDAVKTNPVTQIFTTGTAFSALLKDKTVVTWGNAAAGGDSSSVATKLTRVVSFADPFRDDRLGASTNVAPTITKAVAGTANANGTTSGTVSASDLNGDTMTMAATVAATTGTVTVASPTKPGEWTFTFTPLNEQVRHAAAKTGAVTTAPVTVTIIDAKGAATSQVVPVAIAPLNKVPAWQGTLTVGVPSSGTGAITGTISGLSDPDKDPLSYSVSSANPANPTNGTSTKGGAVTVAGSTNGTATYTYTPTAEARRNAALPDAAAKGFTKDTFTVVVSDGYGGSLPIAMTVTVSPQGNNPPQAGTPTNVTTDPATGRVTGNVGATDPDRDTLTYTAAPVSKPLTTPKGATVTVDSAGKFVYTPTETIRRQAAKLGGDPTDSFTVTVTDSRGTAAQIKVPIKILPKNAPLTGTGKVIDLRTDTITGEVTGKITGVIGAESGETIVYSGASDRIATTAASAKGGTATVYSDGRFSYKPTADMRTRAATATDKSDTFTVFALDGYGASVAVPVKVEIVPAVKTTYTITPSVTTINEGQTLTTTVSTTGVKAGTSLYWQVFKKQPDGSRSDMKIFGVALPGGDFSSGALDGVGTVGSDGRFTFAHTLSNDGSTDEGDEQFQIALYSDSARSGELKATPWVTAKDTSKSIFDKTLQFVGKDWRDEPFQKLSKDGTVHPQADGAVRFTSKFFEYYGTADQPTKTTLEHPWVPGRPTIVYAHGWKDSAGFKVIQSDGTFRNGDPNSSSQLLFNALHERYGATHNIVLVDWSRLALDTQYPLAFGQSQPQPIAEVTVTKQVGETVGYALLQAGVDPSQLTLIGHSLGSYVMGAAAKYIKENGKTGKLVAEVVGLDPAFGVGYDIDARNGVNALSFRQDPVILFTGDIATKTRTYTASDLMEPGKVAGDNDVAASAQKSYLVQYTKTDFDLRDEGAVAAAYHNAVIGIYGDLVRKGIEEPGNHSPINQQFDKYGKPNSVGPFDGVIVAAQPWITSPGDTFRSPKAIGWTDGYIGINIVGSPKNDVMYHDRFDKGNSFDWSDTGSISPKGTNLLGGGGDDFLVGDDPSDYNGIDQLFGGAGKDTFVFGYRRYGKDMKPYVDKKNILDGGENSYAIIKDFNSQDDRLQFGIAKDQILVEAYGGGVRLRYAIGPLIPGDLFAEIPNLSYKDAMKFLNSSKTTYSKVYDLDVNLFQNK